MNSDALRVSPRATTDWWATACDLCPAAGEDFLGVLWLCEDCRWRRIAELEWEIHPYVQ